MSKEYKGSITLGDHSRGNYIAGGDLQVNQSSQGHDEWGNRDEEQGVKKKILILSANPKSTARLRLDEEAREIEDGLMRSTHCRQFEIHTKLAVRLRDIRRSLLSIKPNIVHFTGHGTEKGLMVEDEMGLPVSVSTKALSGLFELFSEHIEGVILSACYSRPQATAISKHIDYVIGMKKEIKDKAAIEFAIGFYDALGTGVTFPDAYKFGINAIQQRFPDMPNTLIPVLKNGGS